MPPLTREFLLSRGRCCRKTCVNCPWKDDMKNGKGDSPRPVDRKKFENNYDEISWESKCSRNCSCHKVCDRDVQETRLGCENIEVKQKPE